MAEFPFTKSITLYPAFDAFLKQNFPSTYLGISGGNDQVTVVFSEPISESEQVTLSNLVAGYSNPPYWLELDHTEGSALMSEPTNSTTSSLMQSIIVSPYGQTNIVLDNMKTIVRYTTNNPSYFATWDSNVNPISFTLDVYNHTRNLPVTSVSVNINNQIDQWKQYAVAGSNVLPDIFKTVQLYGLKDYVPNYDCIWLFNGAITNSNVFASLNSLQKLFYQVQWPQ